MYWRYNPRVGVEGFAMKFFIINSFRTIVYVAYFGIIILQTLGMYFTHAQFADYIRQLTGLVLNEASGTALAVVWGLLSGWVAATILCGLLVTLLDIRDDINDRLPNGRAK
jgi:hypothetical protein